MRSPVKLGILASSCFLLGAAAKKKRDVPAFTGVQPKRPTEADAQRKLAQQLDPYSQMLRCDSCRTLTHALSEDLKFLVQKERTWDGDTIRERISELSGNKQLLIDGKTPPAWTRPEGAEAARPKKRQKKSKSKKQLSVLESM